MSRVVDISTIKQSIIDRVDEATLPEKMNAGSALELLEQLHTEIQCRIDGIHDDMKAKGQDWG